MCELIGIGTDLCAVERLEKAMAREHFMARVFTEGERAYIAAQGAGAARSASAMFAAKEAVAKALGTGFAQGVMPDQIEVVHDPSGAPRAALHGAALSRLEALGGARVMLSLTHEGEMAAAFAVAVRA